jgi:Polyketide cyclase / dehydrase and lipid transport
MVEFHVDRTIAASPERVFDWLADPANLTAAPVILTVRWVQVGALREPIGLGGWFREQITAHDRPRAYSYRVVRSIPPLNHEGATLTFTPSADGTHVDWQTSYTHPAYAGGKLMEAVSRRLLRWSFLAVLAGCAKALEN